MRQPPGGVPDADISADTVFVARVPIYGTCDAGRGFWKKLRHDILEKIEPVRYDPKGRKQTDLARDHEITQLRSVVGSLDHYTGLRGSVGHSFHTV